MPQRLNILFTQAHAASASNVRVHTTLMRHLDRERFTIHAAVDAGWNGTPSTALRELRQIPALHIHPMRLPPLPWHRSRLAAAHGLMAGAWPLTRRLTGLVRYARRAQIDVVHSLDTPRDAVFGLLAARLSGAKLLIHLHARLADGLSPVVLQVIHRADALATPSQFARQSALEAGFPDERMHVVLNGLDPAEWEAPLHAPIARWEFGITPSAPLIIAVGRLARAKGHADLIRALAHVTPQLPDARLLVVGEDDPRTTSGRAELEELARELGVGQRVIFAGRRNDVRRLLAASDIFALPSLEDPFGMVYLEAMALRKPVLALDSGGVREIVEHARTGLLSPPGDQEALAANLVRLTREPMTRARMGMAGRRRLEDRFTAQRMAADIERLYLALCGTLPEARYAEGQFSGAGQG
jgi:glycosyltransferase involved in cell wall biosynthesis